MPREGHLSKQCNHLWILAIVTVLIGGGGLIAVVIVHNVALPIPHEYGIVFDAGSTHTLMHIFRWSGKYLNGTAIVHEIDSCQADAITSIYTSHGDIKQTGDILRPCLNKAKTVVPYSKHSTSKIFFGATAGMRLLKLTNNLAADVILMSVDKVISSYPFMVTNDSAQFRVLSGLEEGVYSWITVNILSGTLRKDPHSGTAAPTYGSLDLGGASTQITFVPQHSVHVPPAYDFSLRLHGNNYSIYSHSYLCYGQQESWKRLLAHLINESKDVTSIINPCAPKGNIMNATYDGIFQNDYCVKEKLQLLNSTYDTMYEIRGSSDPEECMNHVTKLFDFSCHDTNCSFNGVYQPPLNGQFMAFSTYYYAMEFLNLTSTNSSLDDFLYATNSLCSKDWNEVKYMPTPVKPQLNEYCFKSAYIYTLLTHGYNFTEESWHTLHFVDKVHNTSISWALGFMLYESNSIPEELPEPLITTAEFIILVLIFVGFIVVSIVFACVARSKSRRHQGIDYSRL